MAKTLTSANAIVMLSITGLFTAPVALQGFAADDIFDTDAIDGAEVVMGADGKMSAGWVPVPIKQNYALQADSDSMALFEQWYAAQQRLRDLYFANAVIYLRSVERKYQLTKGVLSNYKPLPDAKKTLQPRKFSITWESVTQAGI